MTLARARHYLLVYREFVATSLAEATSYRTHFVLLIAMQLGFYATSLASVDFLCDHVASVGIWNREQFLFFVAYMLAVDELHMAFISESFWVLGDSIRRGQLDYDLLRPLPFHFVVFFRHVRPASLLLLPVSWAMLGWYGWKAALPVHAWALLPFLLLLSFALVVAFEVLVAAAMFWTVEGTGINFLRMQFQTLSRWPDFIYAPGPRRLFTFVLPILLVGNAPVRFLFDPRDTALLAFMVPALAGLVLANRLAWGAALARYDSASS